MNANQAKGGSEQSVPDTVPFALRKVFAENLRRFRVEAGLSQRALAAASGISQKHISEIELDGANVGLDTVADLAKHVGKTPAELLTPRPVSRSGST